MDQGPIKPSVEELVGMVDRNVGRRVSCPCCRNTAWGVHADAFGLAGVIPDGWTGFYVVALICQQCQFVRLHRLSPEHAGVV
jgi:hypothetical protein